MIIKNPQDYKFIKFEKSKQKNKKYNAILYNYKTKRFKRVPFGDIRYEQFRDKTGLGLYSHLNHLDEKRKKKYYNRHGKKATKFSSKWFSHKYLW